VQPKDVERKLTAILAADVAGYSRLMGGDEEGTLARLKAHRAELISPKIAERRGRIVKTAGDGILVEFPSVVDALRCAIEIQRAMGERNAEVPEGSRIEFRVGINLGDIIIDGDDIHGDGVNIAARLESIAAPGGICISDSSYHQVRDKLPVHFEDMGEQQLKNIVRAVRVYAVNVGAVSSGTAPPAATSEKSAPPRLSIVVLPFANLGGDTEQEYFADGVTGSLTTDLSRMSGMLVIGRNTAFTYKGKHVDLKQIGHELGVRYVLEGSVQRGANRIRVNAQLVDAATGNHLWADRFDKPLADLFDMQDEIVARIARQLGTQLITAEARRAERAPNPDSLDLYFQGRAWAAKGITPEFLSRASGFYQRALALDPGNIEALVFGAFVDTQKASLFSTEDQAVQFAAAEAALAKALSLAPEHAAAHSCLGYVQINTNRAVQSIAEFERALALDPNQTAAYAGIGLAKYCIGRAEETEAHVQEALRLSPRDTSAYLWMGVAGVAKILLGRDEEAVTRLRHAIDMNRNFPRAYFWLAAALAQLNRLDEAKFAVQAGLALVPTYTVRGFRDRASNDHPTFLAQRERIVDGMRKAGIPEG
jgi:TolB-like protein/class 3 adenylate cyclase